MTRGHPLTAYIAKHLDRLQKEKRLQVSTLSQYQLELSKLLELIPSPKSVDKLRDHLASLSPATHSRKLIIWRAFLDTCPSPWNKLLSDFKNPKMRQKQPVFLTEAEAFRLEAACYRSKHVTRDRLLISLALQLGLRLTEILKLRFQDIQNDWIRIIRKGDKEQRLPLSPSLQALISFWRTERRPSQDEYLFPGNSEIHMTSRSAQKIIEKLAKDAKIQKRVSPHSLRHTFATQLASRGASLPALKEFLGHERLTTTERYLHVTPTHLKEALQLLDKSQMD